MKRRTVFSIIVFSLFLCITALVIGCSPPMDLFNFDSDNEADGITIHIGSPARTTIFPSAADVKSLLFEFETAPGTVGHREYEPYPYTFGSTAGVSSFKFTLAEGTYTKVIVYALKDATYADAADASLKKYTDALAYGEYKAETIVVTSAAVHSMRAIVVYMDFIKYYDETMTGPNIGKHPVPDESITGTFHYKLDFISDVENILDMPNCRLEITPFKSGSEYFAPTKDFLDLDNNIKPIPRNFVDDGQWANIDLPPGIYNITLILDPITPSGLSSTYDTIYIHALVHIYGNMTSSFEWINVGLGFFEESEHRYFLFEIFASTPTNPLRVASEVTSVGGSPKVDSGIITFKRSEGLGQLVILTVEDTSNKATGFTWLTSTGLDSRKDAGVFSTILSGNSTSVENEYLEIDPENNVLFSEGPGVYYFFVQSNTGHQVQFAVKIED